MRLDINEIKRIYKPKVKPIEWKDNRLVILDQSKVPFETSYVELHTPLDVAEAIRSMKVRGAPAIGITAAYGMLLGLLSSMSKVSDLNSALRVLEDAKRVMDAARPTAVNLTWATSRMLNKAKLSIDNGSVKSVRELVDSLKAEADAVFNEEYDAEIAIGIYGMEKLNNGDSVMTQCNAGGLATGTGLGTALAPVKLAKLMGMEVSMFVPETRPWLQGARLTVYELVMEGIDTTLITDTAVGVVMFKGMVNHVLVGADRILKDGHVFNKVGTFKEAVIAHELGIPFYALAPSSSFDLTSSVGDVKIEERDPNEVRLIRGVPITLSDVKVYNPVFDVTPPRYVTAIITEKGIIYPPFDKNVNRVINGGGGYG